MPTKTHARARPASPEFDDAHIDHCVEVLKAVAHPIRLRIVALLAERALHVNALAEALDVPQPVVSQQLRILRLRRLVLVKREGGFATYALAEPQLRTLVSCMNSCTFR